jgi:hypothetical protein
MPDDGIHAMKGRMCAARVESVYDTFGDSQSIPLVNLETITRVFLVSLLCMGSLFSFSGTGFSQTVPPAFSSIVQQTVTNSVAATIAFTSTEALSAGSFAFHEGDARGESRFDITRIPYRHFFI